MKSKILAYLLFATAFALSAGPANARWPMPIIDHPDIPVLISAGHTPTAASVKRAILAGAAAKNWTVVEQANGKLQASLKVRNKHTIIVTIGYNAQSYSITYQDSIDMNYGQRDGKPVIHPFYNNWVSELKESIGAEMIKA